MTATEKKIKRADKGKKKIAHPAKGKIRPKVKDEVCLLEDVVLSGRLYLCEDECCCLM